MAKSWLGTLRRKFVKSHLQKAVLLYNNSSNEDETMRGEEDENKQTIAEDIVGSEVADLPSEEKRLSEDDLAAIKIQALFRGHLARQAFRALRRLVKLHALVRGFCVRRQAHIALYCMQTLVRLQVRVQARQLLSSSAQIPHHPASLLKT